MSDVRDKLERLQALMRSSVPDGDLAAIIEDAVTEKLERLEARIEEALDRVDRHAGVGEIAVAGRLARVVTHAPGDGGYRVRRHQDLPSFLEPFLFD